MTEVPVRSWRSARRLAVPGLVVAMLLGFAPMPASRSTPQTPSEPESQAFCFYRLDPPRRVDLPSGVAAVTTSMVPTACRGDAQPTDATACIQAEGLQTQCLTRQAWISTELTFRPWRPDLTYAATGTGCFVAGNPPSRTCTPMGPLSVRL
jgi:hypothetical protein